MIRQRSCSRGTPRPKLAARRSLLQPGEPVSDLRVHPIVLRKPVFRMELFEPEIDDFGGFHDHENNAGGACSELRWSATPCHAASATLVICGDSKACSRELCAGDQSRLKAISSSIQSAIQKGRGCGGSVSEVVTAGLHRHGALQSPPGPAILNVSLPENSV